MDTAPSNRDDVPLPGPRKVRSLFLSDIHLGSRACRAEELLEFLKEYEASNIFLLGDIVDFWAMSRSLYWPPAHNTVVQKILKRARHHVRVFLIPGNHDEALREYVGSSFGDIALLREHVHTTASGKRGIIRACWRKGVGFVLHPANCDACHVLLASLMNIRNA